MTIRWQTQLKQRFTSEVLWHFVGRNKSDEQAYEILLSILRSGLKVAEKNVEFKYIDSKSGQLKTLWGYPVACLADIPLKDLHIHAERYGMTAIGFHKENAVQNHFNPVLYVNQYSGFFPLFMDIRNEIETKLAQTSQELAEKFDNLLLFLGSVAKSFPLARDIRRYCIYCTY
ncbi:MAG: hypothetical protein HY606_10560 [Planctomycetes bacterium]|nr:hypothetical protein [Planctomycetota bacterium]